MINAVIWDAGGTLFDTYPAVVTACRAALAEFQVTPPADWLMSLFRESTSHALETLAATYDLDLEALEPRYRALYRAMAPQLQPPFPYVRQVCAYLCERGGANYVVTHRGRASLMRLLTAHGMLDDFDDLLTKEDPYPRKPDPTSLLAMVERHDLEPDRVMVIGDREIDIIAGRRAGLKTCYFGRKPPEVHADLEITSFGTLLSWLRAGAEDDGGPREGGPSA